MSELGQLLREKREQKGASLEDVEEVTRIRKKYIEALEGGDYGLLPAEIYVKGFLRNYAIYLGLDVEEVMALYRKELGEGVFPKRSLFKPKEIPLSPPSWLTPDLVIGFLVVVAIVAFGAWAAWEYLLPVIRFTPIPSPTPLPSPTISAVLPIPTPTPPPTPTNTPTSTPTPRIYRGVEVEMKIVERTWLKVIVDGEGVYEGILEAGEKRTWKGEESVFIRCGNAGGIDVTVNGKHLGLLGGRGEVVEVEWRAEEVMATPEETLTVTPTITATSTPSPGS
jgi:cytoskeletal protein RodZ